MMIRQPIPRAWRIGLGIASILAMLLAYTLLSESRLRTKRREQQQMARQELAELAERQQELRRRIAEAEALADAEPGQSRLARLREDEQELAEDVDKQQTLAEDPDAVDLTVPGWGLLWKNGLVRSATLQGSFERKERWLLTDFTATMLRLFTALVIGAMLSVLLGLLMGCFDPLEAFFMPPFAFFSKVPATAVLPIFFVLVGVNFQMFVVILVFGMVPTLAQSISQSVRKDVPEELIFKAYTLGASQMELIWEVIFRQVAPRVMDAVRLHIGPALVLLIAAEWMVAGEGIGYRLRLFYQRTDMTVAFFYVTLLGTTFLVIDFLLIWMRRWLCPWFGD